MRSRLAETLILVSTLLGCGAPAPEAIRLGPADGHDLPAMDLQRVAVGAEAPDFALESYHGDTIRLSDFRGDKNLVLVFYRGHW